MNEQRPGAADTSASIRLYDPARDAEALRRCFIELQDFERSLDPALPSGEAVADAYLAHLWAHCARWDGCVFVAEADAALVGFVCIWARVPPEDPGVVGEIAYVSDLVVLASYRGRGLGRMLLLRAEAFARERGATRLGVGVLARNGVARGLYAAAGFDDHHIELMKRLA